MVTTYAVPMTAELMSNDTKFAYVGESVRKKKRRGNRFHTLDRVLRAAKKMRRKKLALQ